MDDIHVLGIETSCDDTGVAILRGDGKVLSNCIHSQIKRHIDHGGIIPMVAKEYHLENIDRVAREALEKSELKSVDQNIDAIAVTTRPGLNFSLQVGINYAKQLSQKYFKPLVPIHHMQAHALMPLMESRVIKFPFLSLLLSGGHCLIAICKRFNEFELLGTSLDDAPGDLLDKIARRCRVKNLGCPFDSISGGAALEMLSRREGSNRFKYYNSEDSIPMLAHRNCDFSFSGYRGTFDYLVPEIDSLWNRGDRENLLDELGHLSGSIQRGILIQIAKKLHRAMAYYRMKWRYENPDAFFDKNDTHKNLGFQTRSREDDAYLDVVISGGVAANEYLAKNLKEFCQNEIDETVRVFKASKSLCSDNGLMIAWNGLMRYSDYLKDPDKYKSLEHDDNVIEPASENLEKIVAKPESPIGIDIRRQVSLADHKLGRFKSPELKINADVGAMRLNPALVPSTP